MCEGRDWQDGGLMYVQAVSRHYLSRSEGSSENLRPGLAV